MPDHTFYQPFKKPTKDEWLQLLGDNATRQITLSEKVTSPVFIHQDDVIAHPPLAGKNDNQWNIVARIATSYPKKANQKALTALNGGADELLFVLRKLPDLKVLLSSIQLDMIHTSFFYHQAGTSKMLRLIEQVNASTQQSAQLEGSFQLNPFSKNNRLKSGLQNYLNTGHQLFPKFKLLCLRQNKTLPIEQALAQIIEQVSRLFKTTKDKNFIASKIQIQLSAGQNILVTVATIRAFKRLWNQVLTQHHLDTIVPDIKVVLDDDNWSDDANQNRILATTQAMAAVIGGCDHLVIPSVDRVTKTDAFSERINRNIQHIMKMESNMDRVIDPAAGSKVIDALTETLYNTTWDIANK